MAIDMFLQIESLAGESKDSVYAGWTQLESFSFGSTNTGSFGVGGGGGSGKVNFSDFTFVHYLDKTSPKLQLANWSGEHYKSAKLALRKAGGTQKAYAVYTFRDLLVSSISTGGSGDDDRLLETVSLAFAAVKFEYAEQKQDGTLLPNVTSMWSVMKNKAAFE